MQGHLRTFSGKIFRKADFPPIGGRFSHRNREARLFGRRFCRRGNSRARRHAPKQGSRVKLLCNFTLEPLLFWGKACGKCGKLCGKLKGNGLFAGRKTDRFVAKGRRARAFFNSFLKGTVCRAESFFRWGPYVGRLDVGRLCVGAGARKGGIYQGSS